MFTFTPSRDAGGAEQALAALINPHPVAGLFDGRIQRLQEMFLRCCAHCRPPFADHGLHITPEINYQSEQWLPLDELRRHFHALYRHLLTYPPPFSSTPFASATSWAGIVSRFPPFLKNHVNPADLIQRLLRDGELRAKFLFWSFMPERYYGEGGDRYPAQSAAAAEWIRQRAAAGERVRCLDAACGDGVASYGLARMLLEQGWSADRFQIEGWTRDPLEAWAAAHAVFPHNSAHQAAFRNMSAAVFQGGANHSIVFRDMDLLNMSAVHRASQGERFDLIICNGLLGGPIINRVEDVERIVAILTELLAAGGLLLVADHFHGGWKKKIPGEFLGDLFRAHGLNVVLAGEGLGGQSPARC
jgi:chemotaxis methyl-accepting protein methylase